MDRLNSCSGVTRRAIPPPCVLISGPSTFRLIRINPPKNKGGNKRVRFQSVLPLNYGPRRNRRDSNPQLSIRIGSNRSLRHAQFSKGREQANSVFSFQLKYPNSSPRPYISINHRRHHSTALPLFCQEKFQRKYKIIISPLDSTTCADKKTPVSWGRRVSHDWGGRWDSASPEWLPVQDGAGTSTREAPAAPRGPGDF